MYSHVNKITNVTYVGITRRKPELRWANGFGYRTNPYFWRAIVKYGWDGFTHNILHSNLSKEEALSIEEGLISHYKSLNPSYNISDGNDYAGGLKGSIIMKSPDGSITKEFESLTEAACYINAKSAGNITGCCKGNKKSCLGYTFNYK